MPSPVLQVKGDLMNAQGYPTHFSAVPRRAGVVNMFSTARSGDGTPQRPPRVAVVEVEPGAGRVVVVVGSGTRNGSSPSVAGTGGNT
jgi:hypothetical protein